MPITKGRLSRLSPLSIGAVLVFAAIMTFVLFRSFADTGPATLYTTPSGTQSATTGQSFTVNVHISTGSNVPVSAAAVYMSYPSDKLQVVSENFSSSPYTVPALTSNSGGILRMDRGALPKISGGDRIFAQVTFKAIATGSATIGFTDSSVVNSGDNNSNLLGSKNGVTYNISAPSSSSPGTGSGGSGGSGGSQGGGGSSSGGSSGSGSGSGSSGGGSGGSSGSGGSHGGSNGGHSGGSSGSGSGSGSSGSSGGSSSGTIVTSEVQIKVVDSHGKPVVGAEVTINNQTVKTDANGIAHFSGVVTGKITVAVKYNGKKTSKALQVKGASTQAPEFFKVSITRDKFNPALLLLPIGILIAAAAFIFRPWSGKLTLLHADDTAVGNDTPPVVSSSQPPQQTPQTPAGRKIDAPGTTIAPTAPSDDEKTSSADK